MGAESAPRSRSRWDGCTKVHNRSAPTALARRLRRRRRLQCTAGLREGPRLRLRQALPLFLGRRCFRLRRLLREDGLLALAGGETLELILVDRLALDQDRRDPVQLLHVLLEHAGGALVRLLDHAADLLVDLACDLVAVVGLVAHLTAEERLVGVAAEDARAELLAHPEAHDHLL